MNPFHFWKMFTLASIFFCVFVFGQVFFQTQPTQVWAQGAGDIDDVMERFGGGFGFDNKDDLKQQNVQSANEQNREDVQIKLEEERMKPLEEANQQNPIPNAPAVTTLNVTVNFTATVNAADVDNMSLGPSAGFTGTIPTGTPVGHTFVNVPVGVNVLSFDCLGSTPGPNCNISLGGIVNASCIPATLTIPSTGTGSSTCIVTAPLPAP